MSVPYLRSFAPSDVAAGVVTFSPRDLNEQLRHVLENGVPDNPREIPALG